MPDISDGGAKSNGQARCNNNKARCNNNQALRESRFKGSCEDLKGTVYGVTSGKDTFLKTTRKIAEYVSSEYSNAGEFCHDQHEPSTRSGGANSSSGHRQHYTINVGRWVCEITIRIYSLATATSSVSTL
jgi:hypothetical protein